MTKTKTPTVDEFQADLRTAFPDVDFSFVSSAEDFAARISNSVPLRGNFWVHPSGAHQLAVAIGPNRVVFAADFTDPDSGTRGRRDNLNGYLAKLGNVRIGNLPPGGPPCPFPPLCEPTARLIVAAALWRQLPS